MSVFLKYVSLKKYRLLLGCALLLVPLMAQISPDAVNNSPYTVVYNHLYYLQDEHSDARHAGLSIHPDTENPHKAAKKLKKILDGKGLYIQLDNLPKSSDYIDSTSGSHVYYLDRKYPLIYVEKYGSQWYYSTTTCGMIDQMYRETYPFGAEWSSYFQASAWQSTFIGIKTWQWLGILLMIVIAYLLFRLCTQILNPIISKFFLKRFKFAEAVDTYFLKFARIASLIIAVRLFYFVFPILQIHPKINAILLDALNLLSIFLIILLLVQIAHIVFSFFYRLAGHTENTLDDQLMPVLEKISLMALWALGIIYILDFLKVNVTALLAGISIGGLALALAAQDTVKNLIGSIIIFLDRPFQIGEWIRYKDVDGTVEEVGIRSTRLRTFANSITYIPNAKLADSVVDNMGLRKYRRYKTNIGITYDTPPDKIQAFVDGIKKIVLDHPLSRKDNYEVHLNNFGSSSLDILLYMFFEANDWSQELKARHEVMVSVIKLAHKLEVEFAFPTHTIHLASQSDQSISSL